MTTEQIEAMKAIQDTYLEMKIIPSEELEAIEELEEGSGWKYDEIYGVVDDFAEFIRTLDGYAPISLVEVLKYASIKEDAAKPKNLQEMLSNITRDNNLMIETLDATFKEAMIVNEQGFANFIADRLAAHKKHAWKLRSIQK